MNAAEIPVVKNSYPGVNPKKKGALYWGCGCMVVAVIIFILIIAFGGVFFYNFFKGPTDVVNIYYKALEEKDYVKAYELFTSSFQKEHSLDDFKRMVVQSPEMFQRKRSSFRSINIQNDKATIVAKIWLKDDTIRFMSFDMLREKGIWKIVSFKPIDQKSKNGVSI